MGLKPFKKTVWLLARADDYGLLALAVLTARTARATGFPRLVGGKIDVCVNGEIHLGGPCVTKRVSSATVANAGCADPKGVAGDRNVRRYTADSRANIAAGRIDDARYRGTDARRSAEVLPKSGVIRCRAIRLAPIYVIARINVPITIQIAWRRRC